MSGLERPKSAWKSRIRTPHYTTWDEDVESALWSSPIIALDTTTDGSPKIESGSSSSRHRRIRKGAPEMEAEKQRDAQISETKLETDDSISTVNKDLQKAKNEVRFSRELSERYQDPRGAHFRKESTPRDSCTEEAHGKPDLIQRKSRYFRVDGWPRDDPICDNRLKFKGCQQERGSSGGLGAEVGIDHSRLTVPAKPKKLAPLNMTRPDIPPSERSFDIGSVEKRSLETRPILTIAGKIAEEKKNSMNKLTPLPDLRRTTDT